MAGRGAGSMRVGHGYDLHRLEPMPPEGRGRALALGGVRLEHPRGWGVVAHSDGDALYHAATDAILGALALPDIGQLFPDTDPRHDAEDSSVYVLEASRRAREAGWVVEGMDCTVILERPRIGPVKDAMRANLARLLGVRVERVNVKGKSHEGVDAVGEGRAVEVHVVALLAREGGA